MAGPERGPGRRWHLGRGDQARTALHYACTYGHAEVAEVLIGWHCNINAQDSDGCTPLIKAAQHQQVACISILLHNGACASAADATKNTALHYAIFGNRPDMVAILMEHKASLESKNKDGFSPSMAAIVQARLQPSGLLPRETINTEDEGQRYNNEPGPNDSSATAAEKDGKAVQSPVLSAEKDTELSDLEQLSRDIVEEITNYHGPRRKWRGTLFGNRGQLPDIQEEDETNMELHSQIYYPSSSSPTSEGEEDSDEEGPCPAPEEKNTTDMVVLPISDVSSLSVHAEFGSSSRDSEDDELGCGEDSDTGAHCPENTPNPSHSGTSTPSAPVPTPGGEEDNDEVGPFPVPGEAKTPYRVEYPTTDDSSLSVEEELESTNSDSEEEEREVRRYSYPGAEVPAYTPKSRLSKETLQEILNSLDSPVSLDSL